MVIGIDASRAYGRDKTGTENYSYHLITALLKLPESQSHTFVLFIRPNTVVPQELDGYSNVIVKSVKWRYLWTQVGLAWETWQDPQIDVLWVPAHTLPILRNPKIKTVVTIHGLEYQWLPEYKNLLQRWYLPLSTIYASRSADTLIAVSKFTAKQLEKELHTISKNIKVIHEGVSFDEQSSDRSPKIAQGSELLWARYEIQDKGYMLFVGSIQPRKNLVSLIEAFSHFAYGSARDTVTDYKLVIAGGVGWMADEVLQAPVRFGVSDKVVFTGRVSDVELQHLYLGARLYVQPSITEGFGLPVLEAMASGVPVISSDGGALPEVVGNAGVIVSLNRKGRIFVSELTRAMERVAGDRKLRDNLISMGHKRVREFTWERAAKETLGAIVGEGYNSLRENNQ